MKTESSLAQMFIQSVFVDVRTAYFYHIMRQRISNFSNADRKKVVANTTTTKRLVDLFNQCTSSNSVVSICE